MLAYYSANPEATPGRIKQGEIDMQIDCSDIHACMERRSITGTMQGMSSYHFKRHRVHTKPLIMYMMGDSSLLDKPLLGIVGPRKPSVYAQQVTQDLF